MCIRDSYYMYIYTPENTTDGDSFNSTAEGDLDADGVTSTFTVNGSTDSNGELLITPVFLVDNSKELE